MVPMIDSRTVRIDKEFKETKERERERALHEKRLNPFESTFEIKYVVQHQRINKKTFIISSSSLLSVLLLCSHLHQFYSRWRFLHSRLQLRIPHLSILPVHVGVQRLVIAAFNNFASAQY